MLFSRRKAEIEVLSAARHSHSYFVDSGHGLGKASDRPREGHAGTPLSRYLAQKIRVACADPDHPSA